ncbi:MAG: aldehyde dehydrogenase family protein [Ilumatobacteraceae bacterium]
MASTPGRRWSPTGRWPSSRWTGETSTGKLIMRNASDSLKRVHLELGGKAPVVVFDDADLEAVIAGVRVFGYFNAGQDCTASTRVLVADGVYEDFVSGMADAAKSLNMGDPRDEATELGPVVSAEQRDWVAGFVERAVAAGATVATGDRAVPAAVLLRTDRRRRRRAGQPRSSSAARSSARWSACSASVTRPGQRRGRTGSTTAWPHRRGPRTSDAHRMANGMQFGTVWVNDHGPLVSEMPHGGFKQSGVGKDMSMYSIEAYTELKHVMIKL